MSYNSIMFCDWCSHISDTFVSATGFLDARVWVTSMAVVLLEKRVKMNTSRLVIVSCCKSQLFFLIYKAVTIFMFTNQKYFWKWGKVEKYSRMYILYIFKSKYIEKWQFYNCKVWLNQISSMIFNDQLHWHVQIHPLQTVFENSLQSVKKPQQSMSNEIIKMTYVAHLFSNNYTPRRIVLKVLTD